MKRKLNLLIAGVIAAISVLPLASCSSDDTLYLNVYNWEEYISEYDEEWETLDLIAGFEEYASEALGKNVVVNYSTFGTNENMYNELQLTKRSVNGGYVYNYDLVCPSDYMIQRMIRENMLEEYDMDEDGNYTKMPNYSDYASGFIQDLFFANEWEKYAVGYMWGTMGFVYNPDIIAEDDAHSWELPWIEYYKNLGTIKDSIRDTYALAVGYVYRDKLYSVDENGEMTEPSLRKFYEEGIFTDVEYKEVLVKLFNNIERPLMDEFNEIEIDGNKLTDEQLALLNDLFKDVDFKTVEEAGKQLKILKHNVFGFEVDSGKKDMAAGKIAINFAWSGDATVALDEAEDETGVILKYAVPEEGSNIWFDGWVMPKGANKELAQMFINFISEPENAISNMDYIGYVSSIAGDEVFARMVTTYDLAPEEDDDHGVAIDYSYYFDNLTEDYEDYKFVWVAEYDENDNIVLDEDGEEVWELVWTDDEEILAAADEEDIVGTIQDFVDEEGKVIVWTSEDNIDRQLTTQYPTPEVVNRCALMTDLNKSDLSRINEMWSDVKVGDISTFFLIAIPVFIVLVIAALVVITILKKKGVRFERKRKNYGKLVSSERIR
ncbi:MAG: extracellular solute-binding protein [Clostridia bacterium]|nr:extracellular solute-binding protein [Clostridia bacterium]